MTPSSRAALEHPASCHPLRHQDRQQAMWASGDFASSHDAADCRRTHLRGCRPPLDGARARCAAGNGNATSRPPAGRQRHATDYVPALLERGACGPTRGPELTFQAATPRHCRSRRRIRRGAVDLRRDVRPDQEMSAREMARVCRPGGRIGLASWTPGGFIGRLFQVWADTCRAPDCGRPRLGYRRRLQELFGSSARTIAHRIRTFVFRYARRHTGWRCFGPTTPDPQGLRGARRRRSACARGGPARPAAGVRPGRRQGLVVPGSTGECHHLLRFPRRWTEPAPPDRGGRNPFRLTGGRRAAWTGRAISVLASWCS